MFSIRKQEMLYNKTARSFDENDLAVTSKAIACQEQMVFISVGYHVHDADLQLFFDTM